MRNEKANDEEKNTINKRASFQLDLKSAERKRTATDRREKLHFSCLHNIPHYKCTHTYTRR